MAVLVPFVISLFDFAIFYRLIPAQITLDWIVLTATSPTLVSMFLSNYAHLNLLHLLQNMAAFVVIIGAIGWIALVGIPRSDLQYTFNERVLVQSSLVFLLIIPFVVSGASLIIAPFIGMERIVGFSGVCFAFVGYLIFILESLLLIKVQAMKEKKEKRQVVFGYCLILLIIIIPVAIMNPVTHSNYIGHLAGFLAGITTPLVLTIAEKVW